MRPEDTFSRTAGEYARYRPHYPNKLFQRLYRYIPAQNRAWDCGTGSGQVARVLAGSFARVDATDPSREQLQHAPPHPRIHYSVQPSEETNFPDRCFDLITAGQAVHWFDLERFYREVRRTAVSGALLALFGYGLIRVGPEIDPVIRRFYEERVGRWWDPRRRLVEEHYRSLPFPFPEIEMAELQSRSLWSLEQMLGYLGTWSAVTRCRQKTGEDPVSEIRPDLEAVWGVQKREVVFPIFIRAGVVRPDGAAPSS